MSLLLKYWQIYNTKIIIKTKWPWDIDLEDH